MEIVILQKKQKSTVYITNSLMWRSPSCRRNVNQQFTSLVRVIWRSPSCRRNANFLSVIQRSSLSRNQQKQTHDSLTAEQLLLAVAQGAVKPHPYLIISGPSSGAGLAVTEWIPAIGASFCCSFKVVFEHWRIGFKRK